MHQRLLSSSPKQSRCQGRYATWSSQNQTRAGRAGEQDPECVRGPPMHACMYAFLHGMLILD